MRDMCSRSVLMAAPPLRPAARPSSEVNQEWYRARALLGPKTGDLSTTLSGEIGEASPRCRGRAHGVPPEQKSALPIRPWASTSGPCSGWRDRRTHEGRSGIVGLQSAQHLRSIGPVIRCAPFSGAYRLPRNTARIVLTTMWAFVLLPKVEGVNRRLYLSHAGCQAERIKFIPAHSRAARDCMDITQEQLAAAAGVDVETIRRFRERRPAPISKQFPAKIREALERRGIQFTNGDSPGVRLVPESQVIQ